MVREKDYERLSEVVRKWCERIAGLRELVIHFGKQTIQLSGELNKKTTRPRPQAQRNSRWWRLNKEGGKSQQQIAMDEGESLHTVATAIKRESKRRKFLASVREQAERLVEQGILPEHVAKKLDRDIG
jgi:hypothetical protein